MKRALPLTIMTLLTLTAHHSFGQFNKGRFIADGSVRFTSSTNNTTASTITSESSATSFGFSPSIGYFVVDNLAAGATLSISTSTYKNEGSNSESNSFGTSIGPFIRYYLPAHVFFQGAATFGTSKYTITLPNAGEYRTALTQWSLAAGYAYFLNDFVALEPMLGYQRSVNNFKEGDTRSVESSFYLSAALTIYLGSGN